MLKLVENYDEIRRFDETDNIFVIKSAANFLTYQGSLCHALWRQNNSALISIIDENAAVWLNNGADFDEISSFLRHSSIENIFTNEFAAEKLSLKIQNSGIIMKLMSNTKFKANENDSNCKIQAFAKYSQIYSLLCECGFELTRKDSFIADLSYRRHCKTARICADGEYNSVAFTGYETPQSAIISAVAVTESKRRHGIGGECLRTLCNALISENKSVYLYREKNKNKQFYISNGFENIGEFVNCKFM